MKRSPTPALDAYLGKKPRDKGDKLLFLALVVAFAVAFVVAFAVAFAVAFVVVFAVAFVVAFAVAFVVAFVAAFVVILSAAKDLAQGGAARSVQSRRRTKTSSARHDDAWPDATR